MTLPLWMLAHTPYNFGEALNPGPSQPSGFDDKPCSDPLITIECLNVTSIPGAAPYLYGATSDVQLLQEHSLPFDRTPLWQALFAQSKRTYLMGPPDPEASQPTGGVASLALRPRPMVEPPHLTQAFKDAYALGRVMKVGISLGPAITCTAYVVYLWPNSWKDPHLRARSDHILRAVLDEHQASGAGPAIIAGDFNSEPHRFPCLGTAFFKHQFCDVGASRAFTLNPSQPTCRAAIGASATRRDAILVSQALLPLVQAYRVAEFGDCPVPTHVPVFLTVRVPTTQRWVDTLAIPSDLSELPLPSGVPELQDAMDQAFTPQICQALHSALEIGDTTAFWAQWSGIVEGAWVQHAGLQPQQATQYRGHGSPHIKAAPIDQALHAPSDPTPNVPEFVSQGNAKICAILKSARTAFDLAAKLRKASFPSVDQWCRPWADAWSKVAFAHDPEVALDPPALARFRACTLSGHQAALALQAYHLRATRHADKMRVDLLRARALRRKEDLSAPGSGLRATFKAVAASKAAPISFLQIGDTYSADPQCLDAALRQAWGEVYQGSPSSEQQLFADFCQRYAEHLHIAPEWELPPISEKHFAAKLRRLGNRVPGIDGWRYKEFARLSPKARHFLLALLQAVEQGSPWPQQLLLSKAAFVSKEGAEPHVAQSPLGYRILSILPTLYRVWGSIKAHQLRDWAKTWDPGGIFSGVPAKGAADAAYLTGLEAESARLAQDFHCLGAADIYKCHDQASRHFLIALATLGGLPHCIGRAYLNYHDHATVANDLGLALGTPYHKPRGIPQGCPFSGMLIACATRVWVLHMRALGARPRALADDWLVSVSGQDEQEVVATFKEAFGATFQFIKAMGGAACPSEEPYLRQLVQRQAPAQKALVAKSRGLHTRAPAFKRPWSSF